jgi:hypothetical protein
MTSRKALCQETGVRGCFVFSAEMAFPPFPPLRAPGRGFALVRGKNFKKMFLQKGARRKEFLAPVFHGARKRASKAPFEAQGFLPFGKILREPMRSVDTPRFSCYGLLHGVKNPLIGQ